MCPRWHENKGKDYRTTTRYWAVFIVTQEENKQHQKVKKNENGKGTQKDCQEIEFDKVAKKVRLSISSDTVVGVAIWY